MVRANLYTQLHRILLVKQGEQFNSAAGVSQCKISPKEHAYTFKCEGDTKMTVTISLINMKGGVGKTTLAFNLAWFSASQANCPRLGC